LQEREAELEARLEQAEEREAVQAKEMDELHQANARIATLAFAQAGKSTEEAETELHSLLDPPGSALKLLNERYIQAITLLGDRTAARRRRQAVVESWDTWAWTQLQRRELAWNRTKDRAGDAMAAEVAAAREKRLGAERQVDDLRRQLQNVTDELNDVTKALILSKINQAEMNHANLGLDHDIKQLEKQIVVESVEQYEAAMPFYSSPRGVRNACAPSATLVSAPHGSRATID